MRGHVGWKETWEDRGGWQRRHRDKRVGGELLGKWDRAHAGPLQLLGSLGSGELRGSYVWRKFSVGWG